MKPYCSAYSSTSNQAATDDIGRDCQSDTPDQCATPVLIVKRSTAGNMALGCSLVVVVLLVLIAGCTTEALKTRAQFDKDFRVSALAVRDTARSLHAGRRMLTTAMCLQSLFAIASPSRFGAGGHVELGVTNFILWHHAGEGVPDPDVERMGFLIAKPADQTLLESDLAQVVSAVGHQYDDLNMTCRAIMSPLWRALRQNLTCCMLFDVGQVCLGR